MDKKYDFAGWATKADMRCSDGRLIAKDAFAHQDGAKVPIVWNHNHATPDSVLGYGILHSQNGSMRVECYFNDTENGKNARKRLGWPSPECHTGHPAWGRKMIVRPTRCS